jgi:polysaccharide export outer membrane protein
MKTLSILLVSVVFHCSSWAAEQPKSKKQTAEQAKAQLPAESEAHAVGAPSVDVKTYIIGAEDVLAIRVWNEAQLTGSYIVRPDGKISMSLIGDVQAATLTPEKLGQNITESLSKFINHPDVSVSVNQINSKKYFIIGEAAKTGAFGLLVPTTVMEALAQAGGFKDFAHKKDITIVRGAQRFKFNYNEVLKGRHREQNILLEPGDQIIVP